MDNRKLSEMSYEDMEKLIEDMVSSNENSLSSSNRVEQPKFRILKTYVTLSETSKKKTIFSKVAWGKIERYDLRKWDTTLSIPYKGITFSKEELLKFFSIKKPSLEDSKSLATYSNGRANAEIYDILLVLSDTTFHNENWKKQICIIDWGYGKKFDIRKWNDDFKKCSRGICLNAHEFAVFYNTVLSIMRTE